MAYSRMIHVFNDCAAAWAAHGAGNAALGIPVSAEAGIQNATDVYRHPDGTYYIPADDYTQNNTAIYGAAISYEFPDEQI